MFKNVNLFKNNSTIRFFSKKKSCKSLQSFRNNTEYAYNERQINIITDLLVEHADVPKALVDLLIDSVKKNVAIEYEYIKCNKSRT